MFPTWVSKCSDIPTLDLKNNSKNVSNYRFKIMNTVNSLSIKKRFERFIELLYEEKDCYYVFQILNTELYEEHEFKLGNITFYDETIFKSKGYEHIPNFNEKDSFRNKKEVKAIIPFKTKRYFSNISTLKVKQIIENNISFYKLFGNKNTNEKDTYFKPSPINMDVSYSHFVLDERFYILGSSFTAYDGNKTFHKNTIYPKIYKNDELQKKLDLFMKHLNYKQIESNLTKNDYLILQSLHKFKQSIESVNYSDVLLHTWNGLEFVSKVFKGEKLDIIHDLTSLVYSFIYINNHFRWDLSKKENTIEVNNRAKSLIIYTYAYRNKLVHSHLLEDSLMISITKGINIVFKNFLSLCIDKMIVTSDFDMNDIVSQLKSDLQKNIKELKNK